MEIAKELAGFTLVEAEDLRKAIGKKIHALMASPQGQVPRGLRRQQRLRERRPAALEGHRGLAGLLLQQVPRRLLRADRLPHRLLRAHHPREYMAALISSVMSTKDRVPFYVNACDEMGIEVLPPDVNESQLDFAVVEGKIRFGLSAVKNVGEPAARAIIRAREEGGPFASIWEFCERVDPAAANKRALESLVKCGALDSTGASRMGMLSALETRASARGAAAPARRSLFGLETMFQVEHPAIPAEEFEKNELLRLEKETLGLYVSEHPLHAIRDQLRRKTDCDARRGRAPPRRRGRHGRRDRLRAQAPDDEEGRADGVHAARRRHRRRRGRRLQLRLRRRRASSASTDRILVVKGRVDHKQEGETKLLAMEVSAFEAVAERRDITIKIDARVARAGVVRDLAALVKDFPGESRVNLLLQMSEGTKQLVLGPQYKVKPVADFFAEAKALLGEAAVV